MEKNNKLYTYREFGITPRESFDYRFEISKDYQCGFTFKVKDFEETEVSEKTPVVSLTPEEIAAVSEMCMYLQMQEEPEKKSVHWGSSYSVILHGDDDKVFVEDLSVKKKSDQLMSFIRSHHLEELGEGQISKSYTAMMNRLREAQKGNPTVAENRKN